MLNRHSSRLLRRVTLCALFATLVGLVPFLQPGATLGLQPAGRSEPTLEFQEEHAADVDQRAGLVQPSAEQQAIVTQLAATARWNRFGSPRSLIRYGDYLATGLSGEPSSAVREWIRANRVLFRLSDADVSSLELLHDVQLSHSQVHALLFRQRFGSYPAAYDGLIAVSYVEGKIVYVSASTAAWNGVAPGAATLSPAQAWRAAAVNAGRSVALADIADLGQRHGWTMLSVPGYSHEQQVRLRALPLPSGAARLVYEVNVLDVQGGEALALTSMVDAQSGALLMRRNRKDYLVDEDEDEPRAPAAPETETFSGTYSVNPNACGQHTFAVPSGKTSIEVVASANLPANDIVLRLRYPGPSGAVLASTDTGTSPEVVVYRPSGGLPSGDYTVEVCPFSAGVPPYTYSGTFTTDDAPTTGGYPPKWNFFPQNPLLDYSDADTRTLGCWESRINGAEVPDCEAELKVPGARTVWDVNVASNQATYTTVGNNAETAESWCSPLTPCTPVRPVSSGRVYDFPWTNQWYNERCSPAVFESEQRNDSFAATTNLFAQHNRMHDWSYSLGFTELAYNLQRNNLGADPERSKAEDPEIGNAQAGAQNGGAPSYRGRNNANQITLQDGIPGITNMYLWQPTAAGFYGRCVDGDFDMSVIGHEYTHAISNRMVGGPDAGLDEDMGRAMGEAWSDLVAIEYMNEYGLVPVADENPYVLGAYISGNKQKGIRNYNMSASPLNFGDIGYDFTCSTDISDTFCASQTEEHSDADIWTTVNFDMRQALVQKYNASFPATDASLQTRCADGRTSPEACPGNRRWMQITFDAFLLMQADVDMLDARDAYLAADQARFGGANQAELWRALARRGMGPQAQSTGGSDGDPIPDFSSPVDSNAAITFQALAVDEPGQPLVDARIYASHFEARITPLADTNPATPVTLSDGRSISRPSSASFMPGTYEFIAQAPGYGMVRFTGTFSAGESRTLVVAMRTNRASAAQGAIITSAGGDGTDLNLDKLIDDTEMTNWTRTVESSAISDTRVTVALAGGSYMVNQVHVSAQLRTWLPEDEGGDTERQSRFTALRQFEIYTCLASAANNNCADQSGFTLAYTSAPDIFPGSVPRPTVADLGLQSFSIKPTRASHVQLRVLQNQCTGNPQYHGEQDADPANPTDCVKDSVRDNTVRAAELQVFGSNQHMYWLPITQR